MVDTGDLRWLDCSGGRVVEVAIVVVAAIAVLDQWAISYVVPLLTALRAGIFPLAVIHNGMLVVEFVPRVYFLSGWGPGSGRCRGL